MRTPLIFATALLCCALHVRAQDEPRPGVQAPGFWLISATNPTGGAVGLECVQDMGASYTVVFPAMPPQPGQTLVVTSIDERTHRCYTAWMTVASMAAKGGSTVHNVTLIVGPIAQNSTARLTVDVPTARPGDVVAVSPLHDLPDGLVIASARVVEGGKVEVRLINTLASAIDIPILDLSVLIHAQP